MQHCVTEPHDNVSHRAHLKVIRLGWPSTGGLWLQTMCATGSRGEPGAEPAAGGSSLLRPTTCSGAQQAQQHENNSAVGHKAKTVSGDCAAPTCCKQAYQQTHSCWLASNEHMQACTGRSTTCSGVRVRQMHPHNDSRWSYDQSTSRGCLHNCATVNQYA
jgi:hypothetical protein